MPDKPMSKRELIAQLEGLCVEGPWDDPPAHVQAAQLLLDYIGDDDIEETFHEVKGC